MTTPGAGDQVELDADIDQPAIHHVEAERPDIDRSDGGLIDWVLGDPQLAATCSAAVDPLEIAARLETHGMSSQVAVDSFGYPDVFAAANVVYASLPFEHVEAPAPASEPMGGPLDLMRGALFALPAGRAKSAPRIRSSGPPMGSLAGAGASTCSNGRDA